MQIVVANIKGGCGKSTIVSALADILDADIIDHDNQGTIRVISSFTGRNKPLLEVGSVTQKHVIHDTPPYNTSELKSLLEIADLVIIPCKVKYPDLVALKAIVELLRKLKKTEDAYVVFNDVRKPHNNAYKELKELFGQNYRDIKKSKTELTSLVGFTKVFAQEVTGQAQQEITRLAKELNII